MKQLLSQRTVTVWMDIGWRASLGNVLLGAALLGDVQTYKLKAHPTLTRQED